MATIAERFADGITSLTNKLANSRNSHSNNRLTSCRVDWDELRAMYRSGMGNKIIRLKTGIALDDTLQFDTTGDQEFYEARIQANIKRAVKFMLAFGRCLFVIHEPGADLSQPLKTINDWTNVRYHVFSGDMVYVSSVNLDLASVDYLAPRSFSVRGFSIHPSRIADFKYIEPTEFDAPTYQYGGISEFELIRGEILSDQIIQRAVPQMLEKCATIFYKIKGFKELLADKKEGELLQYFQALENLRSIYGAGIIDQEDEIESISQTLTNLAESDMISLRRLAMVTGLPLSWLVGEAARGLNSTGEGERQVLMATIETLQSDYLLEPINRIMAMHGRGPVCFKDNQGESPTERMAFETEAIKNALALWQMGEDYGKYLNDNGVTTEDPFDLMFPPANEETQEDESLDGQIDIGSIFGGDDEA
jgi:hypothetical protein